MDCGDWKNMPTALTAPLASINACSRLCMFCFESSTKLTHSSLHGLEISAWSCSSRHIQRLVGRAALFGLLQEPHICLRCSAIDDFSYTDVEYAVDGRPIITCFNFFLCWGRTRFNCFASSNIAGCLWISGSINAVSTIAGCRSCSLELNHW